MKTVIAIVALSLISAVSFAKSVDSAARGPQKIYSDNGAGPDVAAPSKGAKSRAEVVAELKAAPRLPSFVDGSAYEMAHAMFMSGRSRDDVRAEARTARSQNADLDSIYRN
jgi:hypothetical protein